MEDPELDARISDSYLRIVQQIGEACARVPHGGRTPGEITLVGASKTRPPAVLAAAWRAGLRVFGENRVQEAVTKSRELPSPPFGIDWHLIGPLQSNKVKPALDLFRTIHSVDRVRIAEALDQEAGRRGLQLSGFLEINLGQEESKHGFSPEGLTEAIRPLAGLPHLKIVGLMAIPPASDNPEDSRPWFRRLRGLRDEIGSRPEWPGFPGRLSMGMSHDFQIAIEEGATHVRVGTSLFGSRG